ncbi:MAG: hypothetical protein ACI9UK_002006 [Candidatus Krumholzibacteriia bacterium]|jgi:hypothetical protein
MTGSPSTTKSGLIGAISLGLFYVGMLASLFVESSYAMIVLLSASSLFLCVGVVIWGRSVKRDLFQKGVLYRSSG